MLATKKTDVYEVVMHTVIPWHIAAVTYATVAGRNTSIGRSLTH